MKVIKLIYIFTGIIAIDKIEANQENVVKIIAFIIWVLLGTLTQVGIRKIVLKQQINLMHSFFIFFISFAVSYVVFETMTNLNYLTWRSVGVIISSMVSEGLVVKIYNETPEWLNKIIEILIKNKDKSNES